MLMVSFGLPGSENEIANTLMGELIFFVVVVGSVTELTKLVVFGGVPVLEFGNSILVKNKKCKFS